MRTRQCFPEDIPAILRDSKVLKIRAGTGPHRLIGIWVVVVEGRVFVRSWSLKPRSWYRTFLEEPRGVIEAADCLISGLRDAPMCHPVIERARRFLEPDHE